MLFWNGIPQILKERPKKTFKRSVKAMLLYILQAEDSYIDVDTIIGKMKIKVILLSLYLSKIVVIYCKYINLFNV